MTDEWPAERRHFYGEAARDLAARIAEAKAWEAPEAVRLEVYRAELERIQAERATLERWRAELRKWHRMETQLGEPATPRTLELMRQAGIDPAGRDGHNGE